MKPNQFFLVLALAIVAGANAQFNTFNKQFPNVFDGFNYTRVQIQQVNDKGYVICTGASDSSNIYYDQYFNFYKTNREGDPVWGKKLFKGVWTTNSGRETGNCIVQANDKGYLISTSVYDLNHAPQIVLVKTDSVGNFLWSKKYPGEGISRAYDLKQTADSGYIVCGSTADSITNISSAYLFKVDANGNYDWGKKLIAGSDSVANFYSVIEIPGQGFVAAGRSEISALAIYTDANGNLNWNKLLFNQFGSFYSVIHTSDNMLVFGGSYIDSADAHPRASLVKTDLSGNMVWEKGFQFASGFFTGSYVWSLKEMPSGDFAFSGYVADPIPTTFIGQANLNGIMSWCQEYHSTYHTFNYTPNSLTTTSDGGFALAAAVGITQGPNNIYATEFLKTDASGNVGCDGANYSIPFITINYAFSSGVTISNCGSATSYTATLINEPVTNLMICESILDPDPSGMEELNISTFELFQNEPNPFTDQTNITYHLSNRAEKVTLEVYDARGAKIIDQAQENTLPGEYTFAFEKNNFPAGIYFYSLVVDGNRMTKKMIIQ